MLKKILTSIIITLVLTFGATNVHAVNTSLQDFINSHNVSNMSSEQIKNALKKLTFSNDNQKQACVNKVADILNQAKQQKDPIAYLDKEFKTQVNYAQNEKDPFFLYYGYALGQERVAQQKAKDNVGDTSNMSDNELQKKFEEEYQKYQNLSSKDKEDYKKVNSILEELQQINDKIKDNKKKKANVAKIGIVEDQVEKLNPSQDELVNDNNKWELDLKEYKARLGTSDPKANHSVDEILKEAQSFLSGGSKAGFNEGNLKKGSDTLFNILLVIGISGTVIVGIYLGIKFMMSSAEDKAKVKESLVPYFAGCIVIYGAFTIWKIVMVILGGLNI